MEKNTLAKTLIVFLLISGSASISHAQNSLYADHKAHSVGDILTVILQEQIKGSTSSDAKNTSKAEGGANGSVSGNFLPFGPTFGSDVKVNYDSGEKMSTNQGQLLQGYMSVRVTKITSGGNLIIQGSRSTKINGELHKINLTGMVRPEDINGQNQVLSYLVSDAKIDYEKDGGLKSVTKKEGFIKRVALVAVGIGLSAAAILKAMQ